MAIVSFLMICAALLLAGVHGACEDLEMVYNGDFSQPKINPDWTVLGAIPGGHGTWKTVPPTNGFEIWQQGALNSPTTDALGAPTGQHLEINGNNAWAQISYEFNLPCLMESNEAVFSFEYWFRPNWVVNDFGFKVEQQSKTIITQNYPQNSQGWTSVTESFKVLGCNPLKITFTSSAQRSGGVHLDNVSMKVSSCSDVEMASGGSFEETKITKTWQEVETLESAHGIWTSSSSESTTASFHLWKQGAIGVPATLSTGEPTGQTLEINGGATKAKVGYKYFVPFMLGQAETTLEFEYFFQQSTIVNYFGFTIEQNQKTVAYKSIHEGNGCHSSNPTSWQKVTHMAVLEPSRPVHIYFITDTAEMGGVHIDSVSIKTSETRDEDTFAAWQFLSAPELEMVPQTNEFLLSAPELEMVSLTNEA